MMSLSKRIANRKKKRIAELVNTTDASPTFDSSPRDAVQTYTAAFIDRMMAGYAEMVRERLDEGYEAYLLTIMFHPIPGSLVTVAAVMEQAIEAAYRQTLTMVIKKPNTAANRQQPLIWLACPDYPVPKRGKAALREVIVNDGRHVHVIALVPPFNRLHRPYDILVEYERTRFLAAPIARVDIRHITHDAGTVVGYGFKQLERRRCDFDEVICLPRPRNELPGFLDPRWVAARRTADDTPVPRDPWARHRRVAEPVTR